MDHFEVTTGGNPYRITVARYRNGECVGYRFSETSFIPSPGNIQFTISVLKQELEDLM